MVPPPMQRFAPGRHRRAAARHRPARARWARRAAPAARGVAAPAGHHAQHLPDRQYAVRSLKLGASGYLNKSADSRQITAAVRLRRRPAFSSRPPWPSCWQTPSAQAPTTTPNPCIELLSQREFQVFTQLAAGRSVGEIAQLSLVQHRQHLSRPHPGEDWHAQRCRAGALRHPAQRRRGAGDGRLTKPAQHTGLSRFNLAPSLRCARIGQQHDGIQLGWWRAMLK